MNREQLLQRLTEIKDAWVKQSKSGTSSGGDTEMAHMNADEALLEFIDDPEIKAAFENIPRWYA